MRIRHEQTRQAVIVLFDFLPHFGVDIPHSVELRFVVLVGAFVREQLFHSCTLDRTLRREPIASMELACIYAVFLAKLVFDTFDVDELFGVVPQLAFVFGTRESEFRNVRYKRN